MRNSNGEIALNDAKLKNLAVRLLDSEDDISSDAYAALLDCLPEPIALELNRQVKATDDAFYLPEDHSLGEWRIDGE